jgi:formylglycine-generating enzyme required for sulfatase activity
MEMVEIPAGSFLMGSDSGGDDEKPVHKVRISKSFFMDAHEVTNAQYAAFLNERRPESADRKRWISIAGEENSDFLNPQIGFESGRYFAVSGTDSYPVVWVTWHGAEVYCKARGGRLPTEAEWEYVARGGLEGAKYTWGSTDRFPERVGNFADVTAKRRWPHWTIVVGYDDGYETTSPTCSFQRNGNRLCDMAGNVSEWVSDWYDGAYYARSPQDDPHGPDSGSYRVLRGGSWISGAAELRVAFRRRDVPGSRRGSFGFRCARDFP